MSIRRALDALLLRDHVEKYDPLDDFYDAIETLDPQRIEDAVAHLPAPLAALAVTAVAMAAYNGALRAAQQDEIDRLDSLYNAPSFGENGWGQS